MTKIIQQFMWAYQDTFRIYIEIFAKSLFEEIGWDVRARAFVVGMRALDQPGANPVCVEPENGRWPFAPFAGLRDAVASASKTHPLKSMFYDDKKTMEEKPDNVLCAVVSEEVQRIVAGLDTTGDTVSFVGPARKVNDYYVVAVLQVPKADLANLPVLPRPEDRTFNHTSSFVDSCIRQVLQQSWDTLGTSEPGHTRINQQLNAREHARRAASDLLTTISFNTPGQWQGRDLYGALNDVSSLMYEGEEGLGRLLLVDPAAQEIKYVIKLGSPVPLHEVRWSRKLIQLASGETRLICDGKSLFGVGIWQSDLDSVFEVEFFARRSWTLRRGQLEFIRSHLGDPKVPRGPISRERFLENFGMLFQRASSATGPAFWQWLKVLEGLGHGSLLIISEDAEAEALRLKDEGTRIEPTPLTADILECASRIDGAIIVDPEGLCHAIGVIVDGPANPNGSPSRGGRYNAALRYTLVAGPNRMAIVHSDDATLDIIPLLKRRVSRSSLECMIAQLEAATLVNHYEPRNFLEGHRFYLNAEQCDRINKALDRIRNEPREWNAIVIMSETFVPHPAMEPMYFLDE